MTRFESDTRPGLLIAIALAVLAVFVLDLATPVGIAVWVLYMVPVALGLFVWRPWVPIQAAAVGSVLTLATLWLSPPAPAGFPLEIARINRGIGMVALWTVALIVRQLVLIRLQLREQGWVRSGQRDLGLRLQGEARLEGLAKTIVGFLCEHTGAAVGALYVRSADGRFVLRAGHGLADPSPPPVVVEGEGLLGQALADAQLRHVEAPDGYLPVRSALGAGQAQHVLLVPAIVDGVVVAGLELGFLRPVGSAETDLLGTVAEPVAVAVRTAQFRARQDELLAETQSQAERLQAQQEELRVTNEELEQQSRALREQQARLEAQQAELEQTNAQLEAQARQLEEQKSELQLTQSELVARAGELERANQYKSQFLANMSHELRTPLNSALILAKLLAGNEGGNLTPEQVRYAQTIHGAGNDLLALINDILDLSRIEAGRLDVTPEPVRPGRLLDELARMFEPVARQKSLALSVRVRPGMPEAFVSDALRVQQILRNLLSNALKFTESGQVSLEAEPAGPGRIAFVVRDSGIGIPREQQDVVFEAFRQADGSTQRRHGGTGLGLTISRELARRLGGELLLESTPGQGSVFTLLLPVVLPEAEPADRDDAAPRRPRERRRRLAERERSLPPRTPPALPPAPAAAATVEDDRGSLAQGERAILVVEDDVRFARILCDMARQAGFRCLLATRASDALQLAREYAPSAVLLDVHLPDSSGLGVLEDLKHDARTRHVPVHVLSIGDYGRQALERGAVGFLMKPVDREQLQGALRRLEQRLDQKLRRVLVIDDSQAQRDSVRALLASAEVEVVTVPDGRQALEQLESGGFDCVVLDLALPDMSGFDLLDRLAAGEQPLPPVIVYTGRELSRAEEQRLRRYAGSIIVKGARSPERLLDEVALFLHQVESRLPQEQQRMLRQVRSREEALEGRCILVAEDDVRNVFALTSLLEQRGARVRVARNGREAVDLLDKLAADGGGVDLVLMDVMMPEMDGLTAMREIRRRPRFKELPIIALTAKAMPDDRDRCLDAGADDYVAKPLDVDRLLSLVRVWLGK